MADNNSFKLNIGGPSIILLLTVLGLSLFAVLSIRAAYNGMKLSTGSADAVATYYEADGRAAALQYEICTTAAREDLRAAAAAGDITAVETALLAIDGVTEASDGRVVGEVAYGSGAVIRVVLEGESDYSGLTLTEHVMQVESMDGYDGSGFEVFELIELN